MWAVYITTTFRWWSHSSRCLRVSIVYVRDVLVRLFVSVFHCRVARAKFSPAQQSVSARRARLSVNADLKTHKAATRMFFSSPPVQTFIHTNMDTSFEDTIDCVVKEGTSPQKEARDS